MLGTKKVKIAPLVMACAFLFTQYANVHAISAKEAQKPNPAVKNIIVMIPDGTSVDDLALSRWYKSYDATSGKVDTNVSLALDEMASGQVRTYWKHKDGVGPITDSAPAGTALATGNKSSDKFVGVTTESVPVASILEAAKQIGKATGVVATSNVQHATPATFSSHFNNRGKYDILAEQQAYNGLDVMLGGGSDYLQAPYRKDGENIIEEIKKMGYQYITTKDEMKAVSKGKLWGMFAKDAMAYSMDIQETASTQPTLADMTAKSIELLSQDKDGFFLMVEGSKVDWAAHANDPIGIISEVLAFDDAVKVALDYAKKNQNTMVLSVSDHGNGGLTIGDSATTSTYSSDPLSKFIAPLKKAALTGEGLEAKLNEGRTNIADVMSKYYGINDLTQEETAAVKGAKAGEMNYTVGPMISKRAHIGWTTGGHTGEDITLFSYLPGGNHITGMMDNTDIPKICAASWGLDLAKVTEGLFVEAESAFKAKGATVTADTKVQAGGKMTVQKGKTTIVIHENKNYVLNGSEKFMLNSVVVNQDGKFYVPKSVIDLVK